MSSLKKCFICEGELSEGETREVKEKGVQTLIDYSVKWKDGKQSQLKGLKSVKVHENVGRCTQKQGVLKLSGQDRNPLKCLQRLGEV